jgi:ubiquitin
MKAGQSLGDQCYHTPASIDDPHGKNRVLTVAQTEEVKKAQREARGTSSKASEKVGYPENDRRYVRSLIPVQHINIFFIM